MGEWVALGAVSGRARRSRVLDFCSSSECRHCSVGQALRGPREPARLASRLCRKMSWGADAARLAAPGLRSCTALCGQRVCTEITSYAV